MTPREAAVPLSQTASNQPAGVDGGGSSTPTERHARTRPAPGRSRDPHHIDPHSIQSAGPRGLPMGASLTYMDGVWYSGNRKILGPADHGTWLGSVVFDGARYFDGMAPDLLAHCRRAVDSARAMGLSPQVTGAEIEELAWDGIRRFPINRDLYIKPMFWADDGFIVPDPETTRFCMVVSEAPMPANVEFTACQTKFRRPSRDMAPTAAKAACLYPNVARCLKEARDRGFDTAVVLDPVGNVAEFAYTNLFFVKDGVVHTPAINGTFLNGITRTRVIKLLRAAGHRVEERSCQFEELLEADEIFGTGNYFKLGPCVRLEERTLAPGPVYKQARQLYWQYAEENGR